MKRYIATFLCMFALLGAASAFAIMRHAIPHTPPKLIQQGDASMLDQRRSQAIELGLPVSDTIPPDVLTYFEGNFGGEEFDQGVAYPFHLYVTTGPENPHPGTYLIPDAGDGPNAVHHFKVRLEVLQTQKGPQYYAVVYMQDAHGNYQQMSADTNELDFFAQDLPRVR